MIVRAWHHLWPYALLTTLALLFGLALHASLDEHACPPGFGELHGVRCTTILEPSSAGAGPEGLDRGDAGATGLGVSP